LLSSRKLMRFRCIDKGIEEMTSNSKSRNWLISCVVLMIPVAAIAHHAIFYHSVCMIKPFDEMGYTYNGVSLWLRRDPSLYMAGLLSMLTYSVGLRIPSIRILVVVFIVSFIPLTVWIWDIPFSSRWICRTAHDGRMMLAEGVPLKSRHFYLLGMSLFGVSMLVLSRRRRLGWFV